MRVHRLAFLLRLRIDHLRTVHRAGTDADNDAPEVLQVLTKPDLVKPGVLRRHMPTREDHDIEAVEDLHRLRLPSIQHVDRIHGQPRAVEALEIGLRHGTVKLRIIRLGGDQHTLAVRLPVLLQPIHEMIFITEQLRSPRHPVDSTRR